MIKRLGHGLWALLIAIDILACTIWLAPLYTLGLAGKPTGRMMISSYVGEANLNGHRWAKIAAHIIDEGAMFFGDKPDHCLRAFLKYRDIDD